MENNYLKLADIPTGEECVIVKVHGHGSFRNRIVEMGFVRGEKVTVIKNAPLHDPIEYKLMDGHISLRRSEARLIEVVCTSSIDQEGYNGTFTEDEIAREISEKSRTINIALVGNPNCGKTSFFNRATGLRERVGNYSGVTVDAKQGTCHHKGYTINLIDLPGTYSITEYTPEEIYVREFITKHHPDLVLNVVDASCLERNLFLTTQLIDMNIRVVMALNMFDELTNEGSHLDYGYLGQLLGIPIVPTTASKGIGIEAVLDKIIEVFEDQAKESRHVHINYGTEIEEAIARIKVEIAPNKNITDEYAPRYVAIKLLEDDRIMKEQLVTVPNYACMLEVAQKEIQRLEKEYKEDTRTIITNLKYGFIRGALQETFRSGEKDKRQLTTAIDALLTHQWLGFPFLIFFMWLMFQATFSLGSYPMDWIEAGVEALGSWVAGIMPEGPLNDLLVNGVIAGVGGVIVFLPNILILFFFISLMEDTGYMARAAFIMDRIFRRFGLSGKSFIPMLIATGCGVPGVMASRTIENQNDRRMTVMTTTFIPCGAKLPIIALFAAAVFGGVWWVAPSAYFLGIAAILCTGIILKKTRFFAGDPAPFIMELPAYHMPTVGAVLRSMWERAWSFIKKAGTVILLSAIVLWFLQGFGVENGRFGMVEDLNHSILAVIGSGIAWLFTPLGWGNWQSAVATITGLIAKENVVGTFGVLFGGFDEVAENGWQIWANMRDVFTPLSAYSFLVFNLLCAPCFAAMGAIKREMNSAKWTFFAIGYQCVFAYAMSLIVYQLGRLFTGNGSVLWSIVAFALVAFILYMLFRPYEEPSKLTQKVKLK